MNTTTNIRFSKYSKIQNTKDESSYSHLIDRLLVEQQQELTAMR